MKNKISSSAFCCIMQVKSFWADSDLPTISKSLKANEKPKNLWQKDHRTGLFKMNKTVLQCGISLTEHWLRQT